jgi:hypothetical protein
LREDGLARELVGRLAALDPDASAAVQVIAYFDGLADDDRHVRIRMLPDGTREDGGPALVELVLDGAVPAPDRLSAARRLGLRNAVPVWAVATDESASIESGTERPRQERTGIGTSGPIADLPGSWTAARTALRLAAEGTEADPGPRVVHADTLGGLAVLARAIGPDTEPVPDVRALERRAS